MDPFKIVQVHGNCIFALSKHKSSAGNFLCFFNK